MSEGGEGGEQPPEEEVCLDVNAFPPEERDNVRAILAALAAVRAILQQPDRDYTEYGVAVYRDRSGVIRHTRPMPSNPTSTGFDLSDFAEGEMAGLLILIHSHPAFAYDVDHPEYRLRPTPGAEGDWMGYDEYVGIVSTWLQRQGMSGPDADATARQQLQLAILGATGPSGSGSYALRIYNSDERDPFYFGTDIPLSLEACPA